MRYRDSGVDPENAARVLASVRPSLESTHGAAVVGGIGGFSGVLRAPAGGYLVATADGVGTKVLLARALGRDRDVARDIVHHCVNDCLCAGAAPLFFLDYVAFDALDTAVFTALLEGLSDACRAHGIPLLGGETAEMPDVYAKGAYDLAGFLVGHATESSLFHKEKIAAGDAVIGLASAGLHTNGYSLVRKIVRDGGLDLARTYDGLPSALGDLLMAEHRSYHAAVTGLRARTEILGLAHITGGGLPENLPRALPPGLRARLATSRWPEPPLVAFLAREGAVARDEMFRTWNAGVGLVAIVRASDSPKALAWLESAGHRAWEIGVVEKGEGGVVFEE
jgi:phosphoribosylformylglycinamidine cyclo-ligase